MPIDDLVNGLRELPPSWQGRVFERVDSTQDEARTACRAGAPSRSLFVADFQSHGRGRQGRTWLASPGMGLLVSILLRQDGPPRPWRSTALASVALAEALEQVVPSVRAEIKWPNDLLIDGRKVAGILAESTFDGTRHAVIVGIGVNTSMADGDRQMLGTRAISVWEASGAHTPPDRSALLAALIQRMDIWLEQPEQEVQSRWQARLWGRGQRVHIRDGETESEVVVLGVRADGALMVRDQDGSVRETSTAELIL